MTAPLCFAGSSGRTNIFLLFGIKCLLRLKGMLCGGIGDAFVNNRRSKETVEKRILRIPMMSISQSDLMPIRSERSDAGLSQCEIVIGIRQGFYLFLLGLLVLVQREIPLPFGFLCFWALT